MIVPPRIWISIEGKKLRIIEDGTMELILEKEKHPKKQFVEIEKVEGDIGDLVNLAIGTYMEKTAEETEKRLKLREKLTQEVEMKLYKVTVKGKKQAYVIASNAEEAYQMFRSFLDAENLMFQRDRALDRVELLAEEDKYAESLLLIRRD